VLTAVLTAVLATLLAALPAGATPDLARPAPRGPFGWPLAGFPAVLRPFHAPADPYGPGHRGVDLGGRPGDLVLAAGSGTVAFAGMVAGRPVVAIDHPDGIRTSYEPVVPTVRTGQAVARGDPIGLLQAGHPGCPAAACLHWGARRRAAGAGASGADPGDPDLAAPGTADPRGYLDPLMLIDPGPLRLLPWDGLPSG
jgi:murein DD-endopeptidase MepM/ murein hydrolase activator NlpD